MLERHCGLRMAFNNMAPFGSSEDELNLQGKKQAEGTRRKKCKGAK